MYSTVIGYNKDNIAISSKSKTAGREILIPFQKDGSILKWKEKSMELDKDYSFMDTLQVQFTSGNMYFLSNKHPKAYLCMFPTEINEMLKNATMVCGVITGRFQFICRGTKIGIRYIGEN